MAIADLGAGFERPDTGQQVQATDAAETPKAVGIPAGPLRRYFARTIDDTLEALALLLILVGLHALRLPLSKGFFFTLLTLTAIFLGHIALAAIMAVFGNTPGKYMTGVRVVPMRGAADFEFYLRREMAFFIHAEALTIPIAGAVMSAVQYARLRNTGSTTYDAGKAVVLHERVSALRYLWLLPMAAAAAALAPIVFHVSMRVN